MQTSLTHWRGYEVFEMPHSFQRLSASRGPFGDTKIDEEAILLRIAQISSSQFFYWFFSYQNYYENLLRILFNDNLYRVMSTYA